MKTFVAWVGFIFGVLTAIGYLLLFYGTGPAIAILMVWYFT